MSFLEQQRLLEYKKQLALLHERMQRYSRNGDPVPVVSTWKHRFAESDDNDDGSDDDAAGDGGGGDSDAKSPAFGGAGSRGTSVTGPTQASSGGDDEFDCGAEVAALDVAVPEMGSSRPVNDTTVVSVRRDGRYCRVGGSDDGGGTPEQLTLKGFDYLEDAESEPFPGNGGGGAWSGDATSGERRPSASAATTNGVGMAAHRRESRPLQRQQAQQGRSAARPDQQRGGQRRRRPPLPQQQRNRFEEPGSVFYRVDDVWDSAGIDHDQTREPYRRLQFNVKGDYPAERTVPRRRRRQLRVASDRSAAAGGGGGDDNGSRAGCGNGALGAMQPPPTRSPFRLSSASTVLRRSSLSSSLAPFQRSAAGSAAESRSASVTSRGSSSTTTGSSVVTSAAATTTTATTRISARFTKRNTAVTRGQFSRIR